MVGADNLIHDPMPSMASEDFAFMLNACPGNYVWLGAGDGPNLHSPLYDFNDEALVYMELATGLPWSRLTVHGCGADNRTRQAAFRF